MPDPANDEHDWIIAEAEQMLKNPSDIVYWKEVRGLVVDPAQVRVTKIVRVDTVLGYTRAELDVDIGDGIPRAVEFACWYHPSTREDPEDSGAEIDFLDYSVESDNEEAYLRGY